MSARPRVEVMHGVNLDQLGRRDPALYGTLTLSELEQRIEREAGELNLAARFFQSNHDGVGAKIKVTTASGRNLYNHVTTSVGFMSSSDRRVHFGLGPEKGIQSVEIRWPSGRLQTLKSVGGDRVLVVKEPQ